MAGLAVRGRTNHHSGHAAPSTSSPGAGRPRAGRPARGRRPSWSTPLRVGTGAVAAVLLGGCLAALVAVMSGQLGGSLGSIGQRDAPEVSASTGLYFALNDMDALLVGAGTTLAADRSQDMAIYASDRATADQDLQQATVTEADNPAALTEIKAVLDRIGQYEALAADALLADQPASGQAATGPGRASAAALDYYQQATDLMQTGILPTVGSLTNVSSGELTATYQAGRDTALAGTVAVAAVGALLVAVLVALQLFLARRYRRVVNPALAAATLLAVALTALAATRLSSTSDDLTVAKQDAFNSILALTQARAVGYEANANESRYLVDPARAAQYQQAFLSNSQQLAGVGPVAQLSGYGPALAADVAAYQRDNSDVRFGGYLGAEFHNITFPGERQAAVATLLAYQQYQQDDRTLRALAKQNLAAAVAYDVGTARGQSDWAFNQYDAALSSVLAINQRAFTAALQAGQGEVSGWDLGFPAAGAVLIAALTLAGVRPRLAEYRR
jgi:hypothetical protein